MSSTSDDITMHLLLQVHFSLAVLESGLPVKKKKKTPTAVEMLKSIENWAAHNVW